MIFTPHAIERIEERTSLTPALVEDIFAAGLYSTFYEGVDEHAESFHVFYSYPDSTCFIGVTNSSLKRLITVLKLHHKIPAGYLKKRHLKEARNKWRQYRFAKLVITSSAAPVATEDVVRTSCLLGEGTLEVYVGEKVVFTRNIGDVYKERDSNVRQFLTHHFELMSTIHQHVLEWLAETPEASVRYELWIRRPVVKSMYRRLRIEHSTLGERLRELSTKDQS